MVADAGAPVEVQMGAWILFIYGSRAMGVIGLVYLYLLKESVFKIDTYKF